MIDIEDAQRLVLEACPPLPPIEHDLTEVLGKVLAADVVAGEDVPPFANSAVDGYAVQAPTWRPCPPSWRWSPRWPPAHRRTMACSAAARRCGS